MIKTFSIKCPSVWLEIFLWSVLIFISPSVLWARGHVMNFVLWNLQCCFIPLLILESQLLQAFLTHLLPLPFYKNSLWPRTNAPPCAKDISYKKIPNAIMHANFWVIYLLSILLIQRNIACSHLAWCVHVTWSVNSFLAESQAPVTSTTLSS
jgi:hypothetical protein